MEVHFCNPKTTPKMLFLFLFLCQYWHKNTDWTILIRGAQKTKTPFLIFDFSYMGGRCYWNDHSLCTRICICIISIKYQVDIWSIKVSYSDKSITSKSPSTVAQSSEENDGLIGVKKMKIGLPWRSFRLRLWVWKRSKHIICRICLNDISF